MTKREALESAREIIKDALLWLERIPPPEEAERALGRGLWDETIEKARAFDDIAQAALAAREDAERPDARVVCKLCNGKGHRKVAGAPYSEPCGCENGTTVVRDTERPNEWGECDCKRPSGMHLQGCAVHRRAVRDTEQEHSNRDGSKAVFS